MNGTTDIYFKRWNNLQWSTAKYFCSNDDTVLPEMDLLNSLDYTNEMIAAFDDSTGTNNYWNPIWGKSKKIIRIRDSPL